MKSLALVFLFCAFSASAMQKLSSSSDHETIQLSPQELQDLENQRKLTPVPSLNCYYWDTTKGNPMSDIPLKNRTE